MRWICEMLGGCWQLLRLAAISRFRIQGDYWQWRLHTAFGRGYPQSRREFAKSVLDYGRWMHRMRGL